MLYIIIVILSYIGYCAYVKRILNSKSEHDLLVATKNLQTVYKKGFTVLFKRRTIIYIRKIFYFSTWY